MNAAGILGVVSLFFAPKRDTFWRDVNRLRTGLVNPWEDADAEDFDRDLHAIKSVPSHYAYTQFFIQSGGDDKASGSTSGAVVYTSTSGNWSTVTNQFTPTDGSTPASSVSVNDWVSICTNASTATSYVAQVTVVAAGVNGAITVSTTNKYGTAPTTASGTMTLNDGGAHASFTPWANFGAVTVPVSTQVCVKAATYTLSGTLTLTIKGSSGAPLWFRGYNTTVGDLDAVTVSLSYPLSDGGANSISLGGTLVLFTGLSFTANRNGAVIANAGGGSTPYYFNNCRFTNTNSGSGATAFTVTLSGFMFTDCYFSTPSTASVVVSGTTSIAYLHGCWISGGGIGLNLGGLFVTSCTFLCGSHGIKINNANVSMVRNCTFSKCGGDGINLSAASSGSYSMISNNLFRLCGGYGINCTVGPLDYFAIKNNSYYLNTSGQTNGFGDWTEIGAITEVADPCVSDTDLHLVPTAGGAGGGFPGQWQNGP